MKGIVGAWLLLLICAIALVCVNWVLGDGTVEVSFKSTFGLWVLVLISWLLKSVEDKK